MAIERLNKTFVDGEVWDSTDINPITSKIDECVDQINLNTDEIETARDGETNLNARINRDLETNSTYRDEAYKWANEAENTQVTDSAGHSGYSAYHYSKKAEVSANAAAQSESNAATSESNAAQSESDALAHLNEFKGIYYGSYAEDPETDPNGNPPDAGDYYWNTTRNVHRVYNGSVWQDAFSSADNVSYDNTNSGLSATNVQNAVDEVESRVKNIEDGTTTVPNADKVDNFHASQTPQANQIPVLNSSGQLPLPFTQVPILVNGQDMMSREFYVDAINGDDNNDGSQSAPFKTIEKAFYSIPNGAYCEINLLSDVDIKKTEGINLLHKYIRIKLNTYNFNFTTNGKSRINFIFPGGSIIEFAGPGSVVMPSKDEDTSEYINTGIFYSGYNGGPGYTLSFIKGAKLIDSGDYYLCRALNTTVRLHFYDVNNNLDSTRSLAELIEGLVKDANGVPRNVISNVIL